ncbi:MAG: helix-turn-helix domain-containing protein [Streptosporangiaceae bacterium]
MRALSLVERNDTHRAVVTEAARCLIDRLPELAARVVKEIHASCPSYVRVPEEEHLASVQQALATGLATVPHPSADRRDLVQAARDGRRRAEQGIPIDELMRAYQLSAYVVWDGLVEIVTRTAPEQLDLLMRSSMHVWTCVDRQAGAAAAAYRAAVREQLLQSDALAQALIDKLLSGPTPDSETVHAAEAALDLDENGFYAVAVVRNGGGRPPEIAGIRFTWCPRPGGDLAVIALDSADVGPAIRALESVIDGQAGVSPAVQGLRSLGQARRLAETALRTRTAGERGVVALEDRLPEALIVSAPALAELLATRTLGPVLALDESESSVLLETLEVWLECSTSALEAARRLYCHRNTVINRLHKLERLTGRELGCPRDVLILTLALQSVRLRRPSAPR